MVLALESSDTSPDVGRRRCMSEKRVDAEEEIAHQGRSWIPRKKVYVGEEGGR